MGPKGRLETGNKFRARLPPAGRILCRHSVPREISTFIFNYDILQGGCVLHWVTALERLVNILQDKMGPEFENLIGTFFCEIHGFRPASTLEFSTARRHR